MADLGRMLLALAVVGLTLGVVPVGRVYAEPGWDQSELTEQVIGLVVDPTDDRVLYATGVSGLWLTKDGGATWSLVSPEKISAALTLDPKNPSVLYAAGNRERGGGGIYKSTDGGKTWSVLRSGESPSAMVVDPLNSTVVYAGLTLSSNYEVLKSTDGGANWNPLVRPGGSQSPGIGSVAALALAPSKPSTVYAGLGVYHGGFVNRSDDGGSTWRNISQTGGSVPFMAPSTIAVDLENPDLVYVGWALMGNKRLFKSVNRGASWQDLSAGLPSGGSAILSLIVDPLNVNTLIAAMPGNSTVPSARQIGGIFASHDGGANWSELGSSVADKTEVLLAPRSRILYAAGAKGLSSFRLGFRIDPGFRSHYDSHDGLRVMGRPIGPFLNLNSFPSQYLEKGRIEDHAAEVSDANWRFMYGLLVDELQEARAALPVGGEVSSISYADLYGHSRPEARTAPPAGFTGGVAVNDDGSAFLRYHYELKPTAGHNVPKLYWDYLNRTDLFPGGWLHDIGLPITEAIWAVVDKGEEKGMKILIQAFQRTVLTYDPANPPDWQVERANVGTDYQKALASR